MVNVLSISMLVMLILLFDDVILEFKFVDTFMYLCIMYNVVLFDNAIRLFTLFS